MHTSDARSVAAHALQPALDNKALWVIVPAYNEAAVIEEVLKALHSRFTNVVVVDDGSSDDTIPLATRAGAWVLRHPINLGQGAAIQTGIEFAVERGAQYIATFDADGQHQVSDLLRMYESIVVENLDVVLGSRFKGSPIEAPPLRRVLLRIATIFTNFTTGVQLTDAHNGLRVFRSSAAIRLDIHQNRMAHASEIISRIGKLKLRYKEVPVSIRYTAYSLSKGQRFHDAGRVLYDLFSAWLSR